jgi:ABC-type sugar transport system permease subunit
MTPRRIKWSELKHHWEIYFFILPTLLLVALFQYYPAASGVIHSFFRWNGADISEWVGWQNYKDLMGRTDFWNSFKLALILGGWNIIKMIPALLVAVCIHRCRSERMQFLYRTLFVVPMVIPGLVVVLIWRSFFFEATSGFLNQFLMSSGLFDLLVRLDAKLAWGGIFVAGKMPAWLGDQHLIITACIVWGFPWVGSFAVLTHLAKLQNIGKEIYEAGEIDGVSWWTKFTKIELPLIMGSIYLLLVFVIIDTIKDAGMILALAGMGGGPGGVATVPALFMIRKAFLEQDMGFACAVGIVLTIVVMLLQKISTLLLSWNTLQPGGPPGPAHLRHIGRPGRGADPQLAAGRRLRAGADPPLGRAAPAGGRAVAGAGPRTARWATATCSGMKDREASPAYRKARVVGDWSLRVLKHGTIWGVLAFAFLPLYLMLVVSLKTNTQFYEAPAALTGPFHWENWRTAWEVVTPTVANSLFISCSSTLFTLVFALCGAYFFARYRMPLSTVLWNAILLLMMMPAIANLVPLFNLLRDLNLLNTLLALIIVGVSGGQIFAIFMLRQFVSDIPQDLFEAAEIDGANHFQQMRTSCCRCPAPSWARWVSCTSSGRGTTSCCP